MSDYTNLILTKNGTIYQGQNTLYAGDMIESETGILNTVKRCMFVAIGGDFWNFLKEVQGVDDFPAYNAYYQRTEVTHE
jgi:hypothetical protein